MDFTKGTLQKKQSELVADGLLYKGEDGLQVHKYCSQH